MTIHRFVESSIEHRASSIEHRASSIEHPASSILCCGEGRIWRRRPDSNRGIRALQAPALPLGHVAWEADIRALADEGQGVTRTLRHDVVAPHPEMKSPACSRAESMIWSGRRDLNPRRQPWQGCTLPLSYSRSAPREGSDNLTTGAGRVNLRAFPSSPPPSTSGRGSKPPVRSSRSRRRSAT